MSENKTENMNENIYENLFDMNLEKVSEFQKNMIDSMLKMGEEFDFQESIDQISTMQDNMIKGIQTLMDITPEDAASDLMEKEEVLRIGKMRLYHYKPVVSARKLSKTPTLIAYALVNRQYMMDIQPDRSVIKSFLEGGMDVYVIDWGYPTGEDMYMTMDDYINWYRKSIDKIQYS